MRIDGGCHCGFIRFEAEADPERTSVCHCSDCQTLSGAPFRASLAVAPEQFRLLSGEPATYIKTAESGSRRVQAFCPKCGTPIYATAAGDPQAVLNIRLGSISQRGQLTPKRQIWRRSRQAWVDDLAAIPGLEKQG